MSQGMETGLCSIQLSHLPHWDILRQKGELEAFLHLHKADEFVARGICESSARLQGAMGVRGRLLGFRSSWDLEPGVELVGLS